MPAFTSIALALAVGGTALNVVGGIKAGNAAKRMGEAQGRAAESEGELADYNAQVMDLQAGDAITRGQEEEQRFRAQVKGAIAGQRAGFAGANIDVSTGTAVDVQADAARLGELDALTIAGNAAREAWGFKVQAEDTRRRGQIARQEGAMYREAGRQNQSASRWQAASTIVTSASSAFETRYGYRGRK